MERKFAQAWQDCRREAQTLGVRMRPVEGDWLKQAQRTLDGHRPSDGFDQLAQKGRLDLTLEALAVRKPFTALFTDEQANTALTRLLEAGYRFR